MYSSSALRSARAPHMPIALAKMSGSRANTMTWCSQRSTLAHGFEVKRALSLSVCVRTCLTYFRLAPRTRITRGMRRLGGRLANMKILKRTIAAAPRPSENGTVFEPIAKFLVWSSRSFESTRWTRSCARKGRVPIAHQMAMVVASSSGALSGVRSGTKGSITREPRRLCHTRYVFACGPRRTRSEERFDFVLFGSTLTIASNSGCSDEE